MSKQNRLFRENSLFPHLIVIIFVFHIGFQIFLYEYIGFILHDAI